MTIGAGEPCSTDLTVESRGTPLVRGVSAHASGSAPRKSRRDFDCHRRHVVVLRRVATELVYRRENRVDYLARRAAPHPADDLRERPGSELASERVVRLDHAIAAEHNEITARQLERHLLI